MLTTRSDVAATAPAGNPPPPPRSPAFLAGDGEMATLMRAHPWAGTDLGPPELWPASLRTVVRLMLNTRHPMFVFWGPAHTSLYNDAYRRSIGPERHPSALGSPGRAVWAEIWDVIGPQIGIVLAGDGATWHENQLIPITRHGQMEPVYWTYSYSPIDDPASPTGVGGVLVINTETTLQVLAEQRQAATAAKARSELHRLVRLFAQAPGFMALLGGPEHRFELTNESYLRLVGRADLVGRTVAETLPDAVAQGYLNLLDEVYATGQPFSMSGARYVIQAAPDAHADVHFVDFIYQPITDPDGRVTGILVAGADVTERALAEQELRRTASLLRAIIETAPGLIYAKDADGRLLIANSAVLELTGRSWDEVAGQTDAAYQADRAQAEAVMENDRRVRRSGTVQELEELFSPPDGQPRIFLSKKAPLRDADGRVVGLVGVSVDITARKKLERELQTLNATLEARVAERTAERDRTWDNAQDLLVVIGQDGIIRAANPAWTAMLGWLPGEVVGHHHLDFNHPDHREDSAAVLARASVGKLAPYECRMLHKDGSVRDISWVAGSEGGRVYASGRNITAERVVKAALGRTEELLRQAQKMQAVGQLTGGIAHDFNNMLQSISSGVEMMRRRMADGRAAEAERFAEITRQTIERAGALTNRLLAFSRRQALAPARVNLTELVPDMGVLIAQTLGPHIEVRTDLQADCAPVRCDPNQLENALLNLAINARDAMSAGGTLVLATAHAVLDAHAVAGWDGAQPGDFVSIIVSDTGSGMSPDILAHAFEPFFTTKAAGEGTGLGLSQVFGFVSQSNGIVRLHSELGRGTSVALFLPRHEGSDTAEVVRIVPGPAALPNGAASVVLLVEDEPAVRQLAAVALRELGCRVIEASDGAAGLAELRRAMAVRGARVDMLVSDVGLPGGLNGRQLADAARELLPGLPVLLITGFAGDAFERNGALPPGMELLGKPFTLGALTARVSAALAGAG